MLGLGKWKFYIDTMFYRGDAILTVGEVNGAYEAGIEVPQLGQELPPMTYENLKQEGNTITGDVKTDLLKGKTLSFSVTFDGDTASGFLKIPFIGKVKMKNGVRIAD